MTASRIQALRAMLERNPADPRARYGLALELLRSGEPEEAADALAAYLEVADDEGAAWGQLGGVLRRLGRDDEARDAYRKGIAAAERHDHPTMVDDYREILEGWE